MIRSRGVCYYIYDLHHVYVTRGGRSRCYVGHLTTGPICYFTLPFILRVVHFDRLSSGFRLRLGYCYIYVDCCSRLLMLLPRTHTLFVLPHLHFHDLPSFPFLRCDLFRPVILRCWASSLPHVPVACRYDLPHYRFTHLPVPGTTLFPALPRCGPVTGGDFCVRFITVDFVPDLI